MEWWCVIEKFALCRGSYKSAAEIILKENWGRGRIRFHLRGIQGQTKTWQVGYVKTESNVAWQRRCDFT